MKQERGVVDDQKVQVELTQARGYGDVLVKLFEGLSMEDVDRTIGSSE